MSLLCFTFFGSNFEVIEILPANSVGEEETERQEELTETPLHTEEVTSDSMSPFWLDEENRFLIRCYVYYTNVTLPFSSQVTFNTFRPVFACVHPGGKR